MTDKIRDLLKDVREYFYQDVPPAKPDYLYAYTSDIKKDN